MEWGFIWGRVMIVYVEGQSCAGKTSIVQALKYKYQRITVVGELPENFSLISWDVSKLCRDNDLRKVHDAKFCSDGWGFAIVDRCYASSLCYHYTRWKDVEMHLYGTTLDRFFECRANWSLLKPHLYLYVTVSEETRHKRINYTGRKDWFRPFEQVSLYYKSFFQYVDFDVPVLELNWDFSIDMNLTILSDYLKGSLNCDLADYV